MDEEVHPAAVILGRDGLVKGDELRGDGIGTEHRRDSHRPGRDDALKEVEVEDSSISVIYHGNAMLSTKVCGNGFVGVAYSKNAVGVHATLTLAVGTPIPAASSF